MKKLIPNFYAKSLYSLPIDFFKENNVKTILCDLDNTLDAFDVYLASDEAKEFVSKVKEAGINFIIISNNRNERVGKYANSLGVSYLCRSGKPFGGKIKKYCKEHGINLDEALMIGDQIFTDVLAGKRAGIRVCLTDQLVKRDQWCTFFNRIIDNIIRKKMIKKRIITRIGG